MVAIINEGFKGSRCRGFKGTDKRLTIYLNPVSFIYYSLLIFFHLNPWPLGTLDPFSNKSRKAFTILVYVFRSYCKLLKGRHNSQG
jgi:hypothetical protein